MELQKYRSRGSIAAASGAKPSGGESVEISGYGQFCPNVRMSDPKGSTYANKILDGRVYPYKERLLWSSINFNLSIGNTTR